MISRNISAAMFEEAKTLFPGGVNSPVRAFKSVYGPPLFIRNASGCFLNDVDGNTFIDFCCSWGPLILGHNHPVVKEAIIRTVENGTSFGAPTPLGLEIGKLIINNHRYVEKLRFVSSGTEAVMSAIRLARGFTGRSKLVKFEGCYHGHVDSLMVKAGSGLATLGISSSAGVPESLANETIVLDLNDLEGFHNVLRAHAHEIAAVVIEPIPANNGLLLQDQNFLVWIDKLCEDHDILLIFDEVISGFRVGFEGGSGYYSVEPDLLTFGKIIGGGLPVGAFGGRADVMSMIAPEGPVYQAGTLSANPVAMAAGYACLSECLKPGFYETLEDKTQKFVQHIQQHIDDRAYPAHIVSIASMFWFVFGKNRIMKATDIDTSGMAHFKKMHAYLIDRGVYIAPSGYEVGFISAAHSYQVLDEAAGIICDSLDYVFG